MFSFTWRHGIQKTFTANCPWAYGTLLKLWQNLFLEKKIVLKLNQQARYQKNWNAKIKDSLKTLNNWQRLCIEPSKLFSRIPKAEGFYRVLPAINRKKVAGLGKNGEVPKKNPKVSSYRPNCSFQQKHSAKN